MRSDNNNRPLFRLRPAGGYPGTPLCFGFRQASVSDKRKCSCVQKNAAVMRAGKAPAKGSWTQESLQAKARLKAEHWEQLRKLRDWAIEHDLKSYAAMQKAPEELKQGISRGQLQRALAGEIKNLNGRCEYDILTDEEEKKVVEWLKASANNAAGVKEQKIKKKVGSGPPENGVKK